MTTVDYADIYFARIKTAQEVKKIKESISLAYHKVEDTVEPLLGGWLQEPQDG